MRPKIEAAPPDRRQRRLDAFAEVVAGLTWAGVFVVVALIARCAS